MKNYNTMLLLDGYKLGHRKQYPEGTTEVYSTFTPRKSRIKGRDKIVFFGLQAFVKKWLIDYYNENFFNANIEEIVDDYVRFFNAYLGESKVEVQHIRDLHALGYLPIKITALPEGARVPTRVPMFTVESTDFRFFWVTNYLETLISSELWYPITSANTSDMYKQIADKYAMKTVGNLDFVPFQGHDFSFRGQPSFDSAVLSGMGHLLHFAGTDTVPSILALEKYYNANIEEELVGCSVNATEHAVMCAGEKDSEFDTYKRLITDVYPTGIVSIVSDTWDYWNVLTDTLPKLKDEILAREGKVTIRPDSGDPYKIICGDIDIMDLSNDKYSNSLDEAKKSMEQYIADDIQENTPHGECGVDSETQYFKYGDKVYEMTVSFDWNRYDKQYYFVDGYRVTYCEEIELTAEEKGSIEVLWDLFGGKVNDLGYKELDPHIGLIYGEAIQPSLMKKILAKLAQKGFASTNLIFGVGSYGFLSAGQTGSTATRDTYGIAIKATQVTVNGEERLIFKDPKTDDGTKKSQRGRVAVIEKDGELAYIDGLFKSDVDKMDNNLLEVVFEDGKLIRDEKLSDIRARLRK